MAFCNSCGATLTPGTKFCNKCGATVSSGPAAAVPSASPTPAPSSGGSSALKIVLIVLAVIVAIGILGVATVGFIGYRIAKSAHVTKQGDSVKIDSPLGSFTANDPEEAAKNLGVDMYPGAEVQKNGSVDMTIANIHTVAAVLQTSDSADKVCDFYRQRFPNARVATSDQTHCNIVSNDPMNTVTINAESAGDTTRITISSVTKK